MTRTVSDVAAAAIIETGVSFSLYDGIVDDTAFLVYVEAVASLVLEEYILILDPLDLDDNNVFLACVYETSARIMQRLLNQYLLRTLEAEDIKIGPIEISSVKATGVAMQIGPIITDYHQRSATSLVAAGSPVRRGAIRVWVPNCRTVFI